MKQSSILLALLLCSAAMADETAVITKTESFSSSEIRSLRLLNLAGKVDIEGVSGKEISIQAQLTGTGDDKVEAQRNAGLLSLKLEKRGDMVEIVTVYPVEEYDTYVYDAGERGNYNSTTRYLGKEVEVRSGGRGLEVHADYRIRVPAGVEVVFYNKVGRVAANNVQGDLLLDTASGDIEVKGGKGEVGADTGSGVVMISGHEGDVKADTGSGYVEVRDNKGGVKADTGSGGVDLIGIQGNVEIDTGSGGVRLDTINGDVVIDTGSGGVTGRGLTGVKELEIDTGSGSVELEGDLSQIEDMMIDTGSGGVRLRTDKTLNMRLTVSAGSGGVRVELPEMRNVRSSRGEFEAEIGNAKGRGVIDTGSGGVRITTR